MDNVIEAAKVLANMFLEDKWHEITALMRAFDPSTRAQVATFIVVELDTKHGRDFAEWYASNV